MHVVFEILLVTLVIALVNITKYITDGALTVLKQREHYNFKAIKYTPS